MISVIAKLFVKEGQVEEFLDATKKLMVEVAKEEGAILYTLNRNPKEPNTIIVMERYKDKAALEAHSTSPHMKAFQGQIASIMAQRPELIFMEELASI